MGHSLTVAARCSYCGFHALRACPTCPYRLSYTAKVSKRGVSIRLLLCCPAILLAGTEPKSSAIEYPAHGMSGDIAIGAEYLVRSFSGRNQTFFSRDHLVVEVALYPATGQSLQISNGQFTLRINKKELIPAQGAEFVAAGFKYPDWQYRPRLEGMAGAGSGGIIVGRPEPRERFPGDPMPGQTRLPPRPRAPEADHTGSETQPSARAEDVVIETALAEGEFAAAAGGHLYFPYKGKTKSIRSVELLYRRTSQTLTLRLLERSK